MTLKILNLKILRKLEEEDGLAVEEEEQEGEDYHTFIKIEFIWKSSNRERSCFKHFS